MTFVGHVGRSFFPAAIVKSVVFLPPHPRPGASCPPFACRRGSAGRSQIPVLQTLVRMQGAPATASSPSPSGGVMPAIRLSLWFWGTRAARCLQRFVRSVLRKAMAGITFPGVLQIPKMPRRTGSCPRNGATSLVWYLYPVPVSLPTKLELVPFGTVSGVGASISALVCRFRRSVFSPWPTSRQSPAVRERGWSAENRPGREGGRVPSQSSGRRCPRAGPWARCPW